MRVAVQLLPREPGAVARSRIAELVRPGLAAAGPDLRRDSPAALGQQPSEQVALRLVAGKVEVPTRDRNGVCRQRRAEPVQRPHGAFATVNGVTARREVDGVQVKRPPIR